MGVNFAVAQISLRNLTIPMRESKIQAAKVLSASHKRNTKIPHEQNRHSLFLHSYPSNLNSACIKRPQTIKHLTPPLRRLHQRLLPTHAESGAHR